MGKTAPSITGNHSMSVSVRVSCLLIGLFIGVAAAAPVPEVTATESSNAVETPAVTFEMDVQPLLTRYGCNAGACHGKSRGQNGFALSLLGFDSDFDFDSLVLQGRGRRVSAAAPGLSLLLQKATGQIPHGGGERFAVDSPQYGLLRQWVEAGFPRTPEDAPQLVGVIVEPENRSLAIEENFALIVKAQFSDGSERDVTDASAFQSNDTTVLKVDADGLIQAGSVPGETAVMVRYRNHIAVCSVTIPLTGQIADEVYANFQRNNQIDGLVWKKLKLLGMLPSAPARETTFHRRAYLRAIGRLPTPEETLDFCADGGVGKRERLVASLLERPEYADFWANKWADLLRPNPYRVGIKAVWMLDAWLREAFRENKPYDQFVRELVTARGSSWRNGATVIFRDRPLTVEIASSVSQMFLGVRLECAKCHHHPFEVWSQDDFFGFAAFFSRVGRRGGLSPPISGGEELIFTKSSGQIEHGRTGVPVLPTVLNGPPLELGAESDPRQVLADWMTDESNPYFAKVMANRVWAEIMGRGLVEPVDDMRATNPASNESLLDYLAEDFREHNYDIKHLIQRIMNSHVFSLGSTPSKWNVADHNNFSRFYRQRLRAEVLLDAVNDVLDVEENFAAMPPGSRAVQLWTHRSTSLFLDTFGRPDPNQDPPCERIPDSTTPQILHLMNSPELNAKLSLDSARTAELAESDLANEEIVKDAFLRVYCRLPTADEIKIASKSLTGSDQRRKAVEDLFWALLNTPEFLFID